MVADGKTINCAGKCHNINLLMGEYVLQSPMISIPMGGVDVVFPMVTIFGNDISYFSRTFHEILMKHASKFILTILSKCK